MRTLSYAVMAAMLATGAQALTLADCDRTTHISHGGETAHMDLGQGRVMWQGWWSQEGTATNIVVVDCGPGTALSARVAEDRMNDRPAFDRTDKALRVISDLEQGDRVFATLERMADALGPVARDVAVTTLTDEPCACAAAYADLRGDKTDYASDG